MSVRPRSGGESPSRNGRARPPGRKPATASRNSPARRQAGHSRAGTPTGLDRSEQHGPSRITSRSSRARSLPPPYRDDRGQMERLADIDIAEAGDDLWSSSSALIGAVGRPAPAPDSRGRSPAPSGSGPHRREGRIIFEASLSHEVEGSEAARIVQCQPPALSVSSTKWSCLPISAGSIRHRPDMPRWNTIVSPRSVSIRPYLPAGQPGHRAPVNRWRRSGGSGQRRSARLGSTFVRMPLQHRRKAAHRGLDFGKLRHARRSVACTFHMPPARAGRDGQGLFRLTRRSRPRKRRSAWRGVFSSVAPATT